MASLSHLILLGTNQKVGWLDQGGIGKFRISWSDAIIMLLEDHALIQPHLFIPKHTHRVMVLLWCDYSIPALFQLLMWKKPLKSIGKVCSCLEKKCPTNYRSDRPDEFESLGEPQEQIVNQFAITFRSTGY